ncbi:MAG: hypothetical protein ACRENE_33460 [Polyangiaceae bacterium]
MKTARTFATLIGLMGILVAFASAGGCSSSKNGAGAGSGDGGDDGSCTSYVPGACGTGNSSGGGGDSGGITGFGSSGGTSSGATFMNYMCGQSTCSNGASTTISGRVYDPANVNPVYNVTVFSPAMTPPPLPSGAVCSCSSLYPSVCASSVTDANGNFKITNAPDGTSVPITIQSGKWRRNFTFPIKKCQDNPLPDHMLRLPTKTSEGDMPEIAVSTGAADSLECLLMRMGIDKTEYQAGPGTPGKGHIHIFTGAGGVGGAALQGGVAYDPGQWLWDKDSDMAPYDVTLFSCEGTETAHINAAGQQVLLDYANKGGRVFASHFHYALFNTGPFATTPKQPVATWTTGANIDNDPISGVLSTTITSGSNMGKPFPEGVALQAWLGTVGALTNGKLPIHYARDNAVVTMANIPSQIWMTADNTSLQPGNAQYFSFETPFAGTSTDVGACGGRVVFSDLHVAGGPNNMADPNTDYPGFSPGIVPSGCTAHPLTPQEKALEFMILDLSSCLIVPGGTPVYPMPM